MFFLLCYMFVNLACLLQVLPLPFHHLLLFHVFPSLPSLPFRPSSSSLIRFSFAPLPPLAFLPERTYPHVHSPPLRTYSNLPLCTFSSSQDLLQEPNWRPRFHLYHPLTALAGLGLCLFIMFYTDPAFAGGAIAAVGLLYVYIQYRHALMTQSSTRPNTSGEGGGA